MVYHKAISLRVCLPHHTPLPFLLLQSRSTHRPAANDAGQRRQTTAVTAWLDNASLPTPPHQWQDTRYQGFSAEVLSDVCLWYDCRGANEVSSMIEMEASCFYWFWQYHWSACAGSNAQVRYSLIQTSFTLVKEVQLWHKVKIVSFYVVPAPQHSDCFMFSFYRIKMSMNNHPSLL